jgi:hypothetical protein
MTFMLLCKTADNRQDGEDTLTGAAIKKRTPRMRGAHEEDDR